MENRENKGTTAGILSIISGVFGIIYGIFIALFMVFFLKMFSDPSFVSNAQQMPQQFVRIITIIYSIMGIIMFLIGVLGIVGGIFSIKRNRWAWSLAGAIAASISFFPCGIAAIILVCLGKSEFDVKQVKPNDVTSDVKPIV